VCGAEHKLIKKASEGAMRSKSNPLLVHSTLIANEGCKYLTLIAAEINKHNVRGRKMCG